VRLVTEPGASAAANGSWHDDESVKALRASIAAGVNFIDTALAYMTAIAKAGVAGGSGKW